LKDPKKQNYKSPPVSLLKHLTTDSVLYPDVNFRWILNHSLFAIVLETATGNIIDANKAACKLFGFTLAEMRRSSWHMLICTANGSWKKQRNKRNSAGFFKGELTGIKKNGDSFPLGYSSTMYNDNNGNAFTVTMIQDLSVMKRIHREHSLLMNNTKESFILLSCNLEILTFNSKAERIYKKLMQGQLVRGVSILKYAKPEKIPALKEMYKRILEGGSETSKFSIENPPGISTSFKINYDPARDENGQIIGVFISAKNITKEQAHLSALQQTQETLRKIMDSSMDVICTINKEGQYVKVSAAAQSLWGYSPDELAGRLYIDFILQEDRELSLEAATQIMSGVNMTNFENRICCKNGKVITMGWSAHWDQKDQLMYCVARDVTERKKAEAKLAHSEQRFKSLVQDGSDLIGIMNAEGKYTYVSPTSFAILGFHPEDLMGKNAFDFIHPSDKDRVLSDFTKLEDQLKLQVAPFRFRHNNGEWRWIETTVTNLLNEDAVNGYVVNSRDITERVKAEADIQFRSMLLDTIGQAAIATDLSGSITYWNHAAEILYGYTRKEAAGKNVMDIIPTPTEIVSAKDIMEHLTNGESWTGEFPVKRKNGEEFIAWVNNAPVFNQDHQLSGIIGVSSDITARKDAERELEEANERHNLVLKATHDVVWDWNMATNEVLRSAENMKKLFGYDSEDDINHALFWSSRVHPEDKQEVEAKFEAFFKDSNQYYFDCGYRFKTADGSYAHVYDKGTVIRDKNGMPIRMIGSVQDVTYLKHSERKLKEANAELLQRAKELAFSNKELEQFAYVASHDLQEPLRMVSSFLTQLEKKYDHVLDEKGKQYIHFAVDGARRMRQIILDILEYSRAGNKDEQLVKVNIETIVIELKALLRRTIEEKQADIITVGLPSLWAHATPIRQIFQNLLSNALLYTKEGVSPKIVICAKDMNTHWEFSVKDNGIGISKDHFDKIFVIFQRLHDKQKYGGSGVGLAITKKIIEYYGGSIWVVSQLNEGSTFHFTIPKLSV
jgi:PAS domain S-box-containing protein